MKDNARTYKCSNCGSEHIYVLPKGEKHPAQNTCPGCKQAADLKPKK